ncbi:MAG: 3-hydroxybenzoate 6-monooxygenase [Lautropia sp.]|nr:3-hydroxybenzoate 6-monooxygenase [Lautropia sp.]MCL4702928.1 3-hydroxybenzoate 6-monooxygenase [Burkholderiaceae bacterium]MDL1908010.1 3-hydroxybenzoate 6-monooxygenase [Betaproteobacteria bacterium PRO1]
MTEQTVLVCGGGIGGLAAALVLARQGHRVEVFEQSDAFREIGAGIQIGPNAFRMFEHLGLTGAIDHVAYYPGNLYMRDVRTGEVVTRVPVSATAQGTFGYPYGVIYRVDLHAALLEACAAQPSVGLYTRAKLEHFTQDANSVAVTLADGRRFQGAALIGADGLWSTVRQQIVADGAPRVSGHVAYRAVLPASEVPRHLFSPDVVLWGGEKTHLVHYPLRRGELFNLVAVFHSGLYEEGWNVFGDPHELHERFADAVGPVRELLGKIETWKMWVLCDREPVKEWSRGRVTLVGDAAHPMLQYLAQGACMAIEDAVVLGAALERSRGDFAGAFLEYQRVRYLRTARVQLTSRFYGDIYHASGVTRELRNRLFQSGTESAGFAGLKWLYEGVDPNSVFA